MQRANSGVSAASSNTTTAKARVSQQSKTVREQGVEYSSAEILLLSKAWISASENTLTGVSQKMTIFWDSVLKAYNALKEQREEYLQISKKSGEDKEAYYNRVHLIFLKENEGEKSFDLYCPNWEYLQDKPKFTVSYAVPSRKREVVTLDDKEGSNKENVGPSHVKLRPMERNSMKRKLEEEKLLSSVSTMIKGNQTTTTSAHLYSALEKIAVSVGSAINSWQLQSALTNCSEDVQRQYNDLIIKRQMKLLMEEDFAEKVDVIEPNITPVHLTETFSSTSPADDNLSETEDEDVIADSLAPPSFKN
jgi:hypothetical protein